MALSRVKTWVAGEVLTAADLNGEINNVLNNPVSLISPLVSNVDWDGFDLVDLGELEFRDEAADPTADGRFRRNGDELTWRTQDARTNTTTRNLALWSDTSGTPAASIGIGQLFQAESADENPSDFGALDFLATDVTAASEDTDFLVMLRAAGAALAERFRVASSGDLTMIAGADLLGGVGEALFNNDAADASAAGRLRRNADSLTFHDGTAARNLLNATGLTRVEIIRKTADNAAVNNSTTLVNDTHLLAALAANERIYFLAVIHHIGNATADFKYTFTAPAGVSEIGWNRFSEHTAASGRITTSGATSAVDGFTSAVTLMLVGAVLNGGTAGNWQFQFAQNVAAVVDTLTLVNSFLVVWRV